MKKLLALTLVTGLAGCAVVPETAQPVVDPDILTVRHDGQMEYRERILPEDDVIIYKDGFGGERAAVKVYVPLKNDYFRDSIRVVREERKNTVTQN